MAINLNEEDQKNLISWLQAILSETQETRGATQEMRDKVNLIAQLKDHLVKSGQDSTDAERKIDETRAYMEGRISHIESTLNDIKGMLNDIKSRVDRIK